MDGDVIARDAKIEIPEKGIILKHDGHVVAQVPRAYVEVVTDGNGIILYLNLPPATSNARFLKEIQKMLQAGSEIVL